MSPDRPLSAAVDSLFSAIRHFEVGTATTDTTVNYNDTGLDTLLSEESDSRNDARILSKAQRRQSLVLKSETERSDTDRLRRCIDPS